MWDARIDAATAEETSCLEDLLLSDLRAAFPQGPNTAINLVIKAPDGTLMGGLSGGTSYGWLLIKVLWVAEGHRGQGIARALLARAYSQARATDAHSVWLDTSNPKARDFYLSLGYEVFGQLENRHGCAPEGHARWFLKRDLPASSDSVQATA